MNDRVQDELTIEAVRASVGKTLQPLRDQLALVNEEIERLDKRTKELREVRTEINRIVRMADPAAPMPGRQRPDLIAQRKDRSHVGRVSPERLDALEAWLREHLEDGDAFTRPELNKREDFDVPIRGSNLNYAMISMVDRGVLRLDKVGGKGSGRGNTKVYSLVRRVDGKS